MPQLPTDCCFNPSLTNQITQEALRQTRETFNLSQQSWRLALIMTAASAIVSFVGAGLLATDKASISSLTTTGGLLSGAGFLRLAKEANDRAQEANERLDRLIARESIEAEI